MTVNHDNLTTLPVTDRVSAGIDFLDRERPGWFDQFTPPYVGGDDRG